MGRKIRRVAAACGVVGVIAGIAGCSGGGFFAVREAWRHEAEVQCLESGAVREDAGIVRISPIHGPGMCGADYPLKVSSFGETAPLAYGDDLRPPGAIPNSSAMPRWPILTPRQARPETRSEQPISLEPPRAAEESGAASEDYDYRRPYGAPAPPQSTYQQPTYQQRTHPQAVPQARPATPVAVSPPATLACPIVSELDRWISNSVQPAAMRWFGSPVSEIKQISAYSCRGMNGNPYARISEHAFGNALDIAAFTLADGRTITVKTGWNGLPEEQGFLRDIQGAACEQFSTVLAPGSNVHHYDHIHVDLMRRRDGHRACNPNAVSGEEVAARAQSRYAGRYGERTGSIAKRQLPPPKRVTQAPEPYPPDRLLPFAEPGADGED
jgi:hypothetical protein